MRFNKRYILAISLPLILLVSYFGILKEKNFTLLPSEENFQENSVNEPEKEKSPAISVKKPSYVETPKIVKGIYLTSWSAGSKKKIDQVVGPYKAAGVNSVVIDIKDFSGYLAYDTGLEEVRKYKAQDIKIADIQSVIDRLHSENIYVIARVTVFQDPIIAKTRPDLAVHRKSTGGIWYDRKGLAWIDPAGKDYWNYIVDIAKDAHSRGFDEINFDYIRFPSDGNLSDMSFPFWDEKIPKHVIIKEFFEHLRNNLNGIKISVDLFGLSTVQKDDLGIGQIIEDAYENFDYVCPMVYPSHYASGFLGYKNPANYPYEVIKYSMENALSRLKILDNKLNSISASSTQSVSTTSLSSETIPSKKKLAELRPWIQDFDLGADYNAQMVRSEIKASQESLGDYYGGFMLWSSSNVYTLEALVDL